MCIVNISEKTKLENGDDIYLIEKTFPDENHESNNNIKVTNTIGFTIKRPVHSPISTSTIFLTRNGDYVGHICANLYNNATSSLMMSGISSIELPNELGDIIDKHDTALFVDEKYRRQGKATLLMNLMFQHLNKKGIKDLEVSGITDEIAMRTYLSTGAEIIGPRKAIYRNISRFIQKEKSEENER